MARMIPFRLSGGGGGGREYASVLERRRAEQNMREMEEHARRSGQIGIQSNQWLPQFGGDSFSAPGQSSGWQSATGWRTADRAGNRAYDEMLGRYQSEAQRGIDRRAVADYQRKMEQMGMAPDSNVLRKMTAPKNRGLVFGGKATPEKLPKGIQDPRLIKKAQRLDAKMDRLLDEQDKLQAMKTPPKHKLKRIRAELEKAQREAQDPRMLEMGLRIEDLQSRITARDERAKTSAARLNLQAKALADKEAAKEMTAKQKAQEKVAESSARTYAIEQIQDPRARKKFMGFVPEIANGTMTMDEARKSADDEVAWIDRVATEKTAKKQLDAEQKDAVKKLDKQQKVLAKGLESQAVLAGNQLLQNAGKSILFPEEKAEIQAQIAQQVLSGTPRELIEQGINSIIMDMVSKRAQ